MSSNVLTVYFKELKDILRDRRTIISMVLVPILFYPILSIGIGSVISSQVEKTRASMQPVMLAPLNIDPRIVKALDAHENLRAVPADSVMQLLIAVAATDSQFTAANVRDVFNARYDNVPDSVRRAIYYEAIARKYVTAIVEFPVGVDIPGATDEGDEVRILYDESEITSDVASDHLRDWVGNLRDTLVWRRLTDLGVDPRMAQPFTWSRVDVAPQSKQAGRFASMFMPYLLIILTMTGGMYPALDITAGEKERNTLETLLVAPVKRWELALGKFLTVFTAGFITMILATISMSISVRMGSGSFAMEGDSPMTSGVTPVTVLWMLFLMIPVAVLFSSMLVTISISARSFKEGQSYVTPALMMIIIPAMVTFVPGIDLTLPLAFVPVVNLCLALRDVFLGVQNVPLTLVVFGSTTLYASFMLFVTSRIFQRESVLFRT